MIAPYLPAIRIVCAFALASPSVARAQSECDSVLKPIYESLDVFSSTRQQSAHSYACSHTFQEFNNTYGVSASAQYFAIGGTGSYNQGNYQRLQSDSCNDADSEAHQADFRFHLLRDATPGAVQAWQTCMANLRGFNCWVEPENADISIVLSLKEPGSFSIADSVLSAGASLKSAPDVITPGRVLPFGTTRIVVTRDDPKRPISFTMTINDSLQRFSCRAPLPPGPWTPRNVQGTIATSEGFLIVIRQDDKKVEWTLDSPTFHQVLSGNFISPSKIVAKETRRNNVDPNHCTVLFLHDIDVPSDHVMHIVNQVAPAQMQPPGTVQPDGKFCDLPSNFGMDFTSRITPN